MLAPRHACLLAACLPVILWLVVSGGGEELAAGLELAWGGGPVLVTRAGLEVVGSEIGSKVVV